MPKLTDEQFERLNKLLPTPREMTTQEIDEERSRQVKCHYASLINYELHRLNEEQLFKVFVLVKNTADELAKPKPVRAPKPSRNRALFDPTKTRNVQDAAINVRRDANELKKILAEAKLTDGYGIISMFGSATSRYTSYASEYVCFCVPDAVDMMVEVSPTGNSGASVFILSIAIVGEEGRDVKQFYSLDVLVAAINNIVKQYK